MQDKRIWTVYMHICPNNKRYIGKRESAGGFKWRYAT